MTISELRSRLQLLQRGGVPVALPRSNPSQRVAASGDTGDLRITVSAFPSGNQPPRNPHSSCTPQPAELPEERGGPSQRCAPSVSFGSPLDDRMSIAASEGESDFAGDDASAQLPPSGTVAVPDTDPEMMAMLSRAANRVGLVWNPPPCPEPSRLDDWFLGVARAGSQPPTPVPFFPEVHEELTGTWKAPFTARNRASGPSSLTTLDGGAAKGYTRIPPVERAVAMQLCPNSTWRGEPSLPSRACKHSSDLTGRAYQACGEAASALYAMALLQVHQAKALRDLHEGGHDPQVGPQEMGVATRHVPSGNHSGMPPNLQPVVRPLVSSGRSSPRAGVPACCSLHGCLCHRLGGHLQRAGSVRGVDGPPTALAHQLPRVASSIPCPGPPEGAVTGQACAGPYGQYCDRCVHQPSRRSALPSHVATRPPSPPLESEASEVASRHSCPWCAQPCGRRALMSCAARRVATPPPGGPADLGGVRRGSGRPDCLARNLPLPVVLLPVRGDTRYRCTGVQLALGPSQVCVSPSEPTCTGLVQSQGGRGAGLASCALLAQPDLVPGTHAPC